MAFPFIIKSERAVVQYILTEESSREVITTDGGRSFIQNRS